ncbi:hypothetical protein [Trujillonella humicola]|uniref:hypothetical protein n=1 Tax=Trujillonella humicola TaxID=3383699 RepID=UPI0039068BC3
MPVPSPATACRSVVVLAFLVPLAVAGSPGAASAVLALALVALWMAPLLTGRAARAVPAAGSAGPVLEPAEARAA